MKIILVRHGETESDVNEIIQGQTVNDILNDKGIRQAKTLKQKLLSTKIDICFTSPLARTWSTAMILVGERVEIKEDKRLLERYFGELEGKSEQNYDYIKYWDYNLNCSDLGVESVNELLKRTKEFLIDIYQKYPDSTVLIVSHAATIRALHIILKEKLLDTNLLNMEIENCYYKEYNFNGVLK